MWRGRHREILERVRSRRPGMIEEERAVLRDVAKWEERPREGKGGKETKSVGATASRAAV